MHAAGAVVTGDYYAGFTQRLLHKFAHLSISEHNLHDILTNYFTLALAAYMNQQRVIPPEEPTVTSLLMFM